jgi:Cu2+-exporting ATPase
LDLFSCNNPGASAITHDTAIVCFKLEFSGDKYVLLALSSFIYLYGGMPFLKGMVSEIRNNAIGMMTLVAVAISVAFIYS